MMFIIKITSPRGADEFTGCSNPFPFNFSFAPSSKPLGILTLNALLPVSILFIVPENTSIV